MLCRNPRMISVAKGTFGAGTVVRAIC
jgi:hypothetical protein